MHLPTLIRTALASASVLGLASAYTWKNVKIGGGGGFVPGIVFNPTTKGVAYARTDIGGLYSLNSADDSWKPLTDGIASSTGWHNWGIDAIATDPVDSKRVYAAVGMYTNSWDPSNGAIIRSADSGATWSTTSLSFKVGGNMPGRGMGERLAVDPKNNNIIYFGARSGNGLWRSTDQGATFSKVSSFTAVGTYIADASDTNGYLNDIQGLAFITMDSNTTATTSRIFVGTASKDSSSIFVSNNAGVTWTAVAGQPTGYLPHKCKLSPLEHALYISYSDTSGPYDGSAGSVWRYDITAGTWKDITPVTGSDLYFGFGGLAVDNQKAGTLMVASLNSWWPDAQIFRSNNSGTTWARIWEWNGYPNMNKYYGYSTPKAPWIKASRLSTDTKEVGWMIEALEINPFDSNHWLYGTGLTIYGGHDLLSWDTKHNVTIGSLADGVEETAVQALAAAPGAPGGSLLLSAVGDVGGFRHTSLTTPPTAEFLTPAFTTNTDIDYAGNTATTAVRVGNTATDGTPQVALSNDGGASWSTNYGATTGLAGGKIAISANADTVLWAPSTGSTSVLVSQYTSSFSTISTLPTTGGVAIASDKRNGTVFYAGAAGKFYLSTDTGKTFTSVATLGSATSVRKIAVNPTLAGDVWVATDVGIFHSTTYGGTFTQTSTTITDVYAITLGKGSGSYYNVYAMGTVGGTAGLYSSADTGSTWTSIMSGQTFGAVSATCLAASKDTTGQVYVGTNGRGVFVGTP